MLKAAISQNLKYRVTFPFRFTEGPQETRHSARRASTQIRSRL